MMLTTRFVAFCLLLQTANVLGSGWGNSHHGLMNQAARTSHGNLNHGEDVAYDATVTTEMSYYESEEIDKEDSKSEKKRSYRAEYEYVSAGDHYVASKSDKSGKKGGHYTHAPTHMEDFEKGSKKGSYYTHAPVSMETYYPSGKGKGKGGKYSESTTTSSTSGKGKGSSRGKGSSSGKGGKKGGYDPTYIPHPTTPPAPSGDYPSTRPPSPTTHRIPGTRPTLAPAYSPSITASPTDEGSIAYDLAPFSLLYETETKRQASRAELAEVTDVTRLYLEDFMLAEFFGSSFTFLDDFITRMITSTFLMGDVPYVIDYSSTARFNPFSIITPSIEELNEALVIAFSGSNMAEYESRLAGLPDNNVFHGATVFFGEPIVRVAKKSTSNAATIAAAAVAATLLAAGAVLYKRRVQGEHFDENDLNKGKGDATVAGDTFAGETYDGSASASVASLDHLSRYRDEDNHEEGTKGQSLLRTIDEDEDDDSVRPTWGANSSYEDEEEGIHTLRNTMDDISTVSEGADNRVLRRVATEGSSVAAYTADGSVPRVQSFDEMALQGLAHRVTRKETCSDASSDSSEAEDDDDRFHCQDELAQDSKPEIASLLSHDSMDDQSIARTISSSSSSRTSRRPKTVEEIEAMLSADTDGYDEESQAASARSRSFGNENSTTATSQRPRTVEEIESLLSVGLDDDGSEGTELD